MKSIKRIGQKESLMTISIQLQKLESQSIYIPEDFTVLWKRGPQSEASKQYKFFQSQISLNMDDQFERVSKFR